MCAVQTPVVQGSTVTENLISLNQIYITYFLEILSNFAQIRKKKSDNE